MLILESKAIMLTDEQYEQELAKRREFLDRTDGWDTLIGCPGCWETPKAMTKGQDKGTKTTKVSEGSEGASFASPTVD
jgi:hypothetical protein